MKTLQYCLSFALILLTGMLHNLSAATNIVGDLQVDGAINQTDQTATNTLAGSLHITGSLNVQNPLSVPCQGNISMGDYTQGVSTGGVSGTMAPGFEGAVQVNSGGSLVGVTGLTYSVEETGAAVSSTVEYRMNDNAATPTIVNSGSMPGGLAATASRNTDILHQTGHVGAGCFHMNGSSDTITVSDNPGWDFGANDFSVSLWMKFDTFNNYVCFFRQCNSNLGRSLETFLHTNGNIYFYTWQNDAATTKTWPWTPSLNTWYHFVFIKTGSSIELIINNISQGSGSAAASLDDSTAPITIGCEGATKVLDGCIDQVQVWNGTALDSMQIAALYNNGNGEEDALAATMLQKCLNFHGGVIYAREVVEHCKDFRGDGLGVIKRIKPRNTSKITTWTPADVANNPPQIRTGTGRSLNKMLGVAIRAIQQLEERIAELEAKLGINTEQKTPGNTDRANNTGSSATNNPGRLKLKLQQQKGRKGEEEEDLSFAATNTIATITR